jgi:hypothetical protein
LSSDVPVLPEFERTASKTRRLDLKNRALLFHKNWGIFPQLASAKP